MTKERWREVTKAHPCPACGRGDWCAWTPDSTMLKCERTAEAPVGMELVKAQDAGGLFRPAGQKARRVAVPARKAHKEPTIYPALEAAQAAALAQVQAKARRDGLDPAGVNFSERWQYTPGFYMARFDLPDTDPDTRKPHKTFRPLSRYGDGWAIADPPGLLPLYGADQLPPTGLLFLAEGERKVDVLRKIGLPAVCSAHGCGSAHNSDWRLLAGREIIALPDNDVGGRKYPVEVAGIVARLNPPATVGVVELAGLPPAGDIADWTGPDGPMGAKTAEEIKSAILDLAAAAEAVTAASAAKTLAAVEIIPFAQFPVDALPEPCQAFVRRAATSIGCDPCFIALPLLSAAAGCIGNARRVRLKPGWTEPAVVWSAIIGESGTHKTPALEAVFGPLEERQAEAMRQYERERLAYEDERLRYDAEFAQWKHGKNRDAEPPARRNPPVCWRVAVGDITVEAMADRLADNPRGLLLKRDELAGWLGSFNQYKRDRGGDTAAWLEMFNAGTIQVDRKTGERRVIHVPRAAVSVAGGVQPETLRRALGRQHFEDGLAARLLLAMPPDRLRRWTDDGLPLSIVKALDDLYGRLLALDMAEHEELDGDYRPEPIILELADGAKAVWVEFYNRHAQDLAQLAGDVRAAYSKLEGYVPRLALVFHCVGMVMEDARRTCEPVGAESVEAAVRVVEWFKGEARRVYGVLGETEEEAEQRRLVEIVGKHGGRVTVRELQQASREYRQSAQSAEEALQGLVQARLGAWEDLPPGPQGGRPTRAFRLHSAGNGNGTPANPENPQVVLPLPPPHDSAEALGAPERQPADADEEPPDEGCQGSDGGVLRAQLAQAVLDPDIPGPVDRLTPERRQRYLAIYWSRSPSMPAEERHRRAWRAAVGG